MPYNIWVPNLKLQVIKLKLFRLKALISQLLIFRDKSRISSHEEEFIINENKARYTYLFQSLTNRGDSFEYITDSCLVSDKTDICHSFVTILRKDCQRYDGSWQDFLLDLIVINFIERLFL